jgi:hypothetical protein
MGTLAECGNKLLDVIAVDVACISMGAAGAVLVDICITEVVVVVVVVVAGSKNLVLRTTGSVLMVDSCGCSSVAVVVVILVLVVADGFGTCTTTLLGVSSRFANRLARFRLTVVGTKAMAVPADPTA